MDQLTHLTAAFLFVGSITTAVYRLFKWLDR